MNSTIDYRPSSVQQVALIALRTAIGWHFLYEGYYKIALPGWSAAGAPIARWSSAAYLNSATGPLARLFRRGIEAGWAGWIDNTVKIGLLLVGLSLMLGLFTRAGCWGAILFLALFYLTAIPLSGIQQPGSEGAYLIVNKTLVEGVAVGVLSVFRTGEIAGLDLLIAGARKRRLRRTEAASVRPPASVEAEAEASP